MPTSFLLAHARARLIKKKHKLIALLVLAPVKKQNRGQAYPYLWYTFWIAIPFKCLQFSSCVRATGRPRIISRQNFPKRTHVLPIPGDPYSGHSIHSAIRSRMNGIVFRSFRKRNRSQKNTHTVFSVSSYSGIVPKERALG